MLVLLAAASLGASLVANAQLQRALSVDLRTPETQTWYPWTVRADLLLLATLAVVLVRLAAEPRWLAWPADWWTSNSRVLLPTGGIVVVAAGLFRPIDALAAGVALAALVWLALPVARATDMHVLRASGLAIGLRLALALALGAYGLRIHDDPAVFDDETGYHRAALQLAQIMTTGYGDLDFEWRNYAGHQLDLIGGMYATVGADLMLPRMLNALLGALVVPVAYRLAAQLFDVGAARAVAWLLAVWPLLILWGATALREPLIVLCGLALPWLLVRAPESPGVRPKNGRHETDIGRTPFDRPARGAATTALSGFWAAPLATLCLRVLAGAMCLFVLASLRPLAAFACVGALAIGSLVLLVRRRLRRPLLVLAPIAALAALALVSMASGFGGGGTAQVANQLTPRAIEYRLAAAQLTPLLEHDASKLPSAPDGLSLPLGTIVRVQLPGHGRLETAVLYWYETEPSRYVVKFADASTASLLPPAVEPMRDENVGWSALVGRWADGARTLLLPVVPGFAPPRQLATIPDTLAFDAVLVLAVFSLLRSPRPSSLAWLVLAAYATILLAGLSIGSTNLGTALRHRSTLVPWLAVLAAPGLVHVARYVWGGRQFAAIRSTAQGLGILGSRGSRAPQA